jgi:hypothetical protein
MTVDALAVETMPLRRAWLSLLWITPLTVLWTWAIYEFPALVDSGFSTLSARIFVHGILAMGLWLGLERTAMSPVQRRNTWLALMVPLTLWAAIAWTGAINGAFTPGASWLPVLPMAILLPVILGAPLLLVSKRVGLVLDAMPKSWLIGLQVYRVLGSQWLTFWLRGALPGIFAVPAGTGDVLTGLFALPAAIAVAAGSAEGQKAAVVWNIFGIADFAVAITMGLVTSPGPLQLIVPDVVSIGTETYPNVLTPAFVVPSSILLHMLSLRQLLWRNSRDVQGKA